MTVTENNCNKNETHCAFRTSTHRFSNCIDHSVNGIIPEMKKNLKTRIIIPIKEMVTKVGYELKRIPFSQFDCSS
jgi:hypothetical protein